jgi:hypothetical protein
MVGGRYADPRFSPPSAPHDVKYSRFRGGPTSMGAFGRVVTTILLILLACIVYVYVFPVTVGESGPRDVALYALVAVPALIVVLRRVWRAHRIG